MDGNNGQSDVNEDVMSKLEADLQKLTHEANSNTEVGETLRTDLPTNTQNLQPETQQPEPVIVEPSHHDIQNDPPAASEPTKKGSPMLIISLGLVVVALLAAIAYVIGIKFFSGAPKQIACTAEAKVCDDGTSVGRSGPNCEFDACPVVSATPEATPDPTAYWKTYSNQTYGYSFKFPDTESIKVTNHTGYLSTVSLINKVTNFEDLVVFISNSDQTPKNLTNAKTTNVSGVEAIRFSMPSGQNPPQESVYFSNNKNYFSIQFNWDDKDQTAVDTFDQIMSTFKFIEATPSGSATSSPSATPIGY